MNFTFRTVSIVVSLLLFVAIAIADSNIKVGSVAPDFTLPNQEGKPMSLKQFHGKWVVLYFYPKDFTNGCTIEAHGFQADLSKYQKRNAEIVGVSADTAESHAQFCAKEGLNFHLLADPKGDVLAKYDSLNPEKGRALRNTFLIDPQGRIAKVFMAVDPNHHSAEVLSALDQVQSAKK